MLNKVWVLFTEISNGKMLRPDVFLFYCSVTHYHKISNLTDIYYLTVSMGQDSGHSLARFSAYDHTRL